MSSQNMTLMIGNIDTYNDYMMVRRIAGHAGYAASVKRMDDCNATIDLGTDKHRSDAGISLKSVDAMIGRYARYGFAVQVVHS